MATRKMTESDGFQVLVRCSQHTNRTLHDVADDLVITGTLPERLGK